MNDLSHPKTDAFNLKNLFPDPKELARVMMGRESFSGRLLTDPQFYDAMVITCIIEREIHKSGAFKEKLGDYAYAFARTEKFDVMKAETILRDLFKARTGMTMNDMREKLADREEKLSKQEKSLALEFAHAVGTMIHQGDKINFNRAYAHQAQQLAAELQITDAGAKRLMNDMFDAAEDRDLYEWGKEMEGQFYLPQIEAEKEQREKDRKRTGHDRDTRTPDSEESRSRRSARSEDASMRHDRPSRSAPALRR